MWLPKSFLYAMKDTFTYIISDYVLYELETTCTKRTVIFDNESVCRFLDFMSLDITSSRELILDKKYTYDPADLQILQDAIDARCDVLLTNNIKDFNTDLISEDFGIKVSEKIM